MFESNDEVRAYLNAIDTAYSLELPRDLLLEIVHWTNVSYDFALNALMGFSEESDDLAKLLLTQLDKTRASTGRVRVDRQMPESVISAIAFGLLEVTRQHNQIGDNLMLLVSNLLRVDKHRVAVERNQCKAAQTLRLAYVESQHQGVSIRKLSKMTGIPPSTIARYRDDANYKNRVETCRDMHPDDVNRLESILGPEPS